MDNISCLTSSRYNSNVLLFIGAQIDDSTSHAEAERPRVEML